jgi:hypothetical protein
VLSWEWWGCLEEFLCSCCFQQFRGLNSRLCTMPLALFALVIVLEPGFHFLPRPAWTALLLFKLPAIAQMTSACHYRQAFFCWDGIWQPFFFFFCLGWPGAMTLPISVSFVGWNSRSTLHPTIGWDGISWIFLPRQISQSQPSK